MGCVCPCGHRFDRSTLILDDHEVKGFVRACFPDPGGNILSSHGFATQSNDDDAENIGVSPMRDKNPPG